LFGVSRQVKYRALVALADAGIITRNGRVGNSHITLNIV
jgi:hypothetical protein